MITYGSTTLTSYNSIVKTEVYYYKSTSATSLSGGSWATTKPTWENGKYIWQKIRTIYEDGTHSESDPVNITGQQGATGTAAYSFKLNSSDSIIGKTKDGEYTIKKITFSATYKQGTGAVSAYNGRFKIESTTNGSTWKTEYTSSGDESSKAFTIPDDIIAIKCSLYQSGGTTVLLDIVTVPVVKDGVDAIGLRDSIPYYLASDKDTGITRLTQGWTRYRPQLTAEKKYLWVYYVSRYSEGSTEPELIEIKDDLVHFVNNGDESPVESCVVDIEPVQDLNGYDHPWPAGGGKNMLNPSDPDYGNYTIGPDGALTSENTRIATGFIPCGEGVQLTFSTNQKTDGVGTAVQFAFAGIAAYDKDKNFLIRATVNNKRTVTFATPTGTKYVRAFEQITIRGSSVTATPTDFATYEQQLELGSTATDYEPYSNICPITGWTGVKVTRTGKNLFYSGVDKTNTLNGVTGTFDAKTQTISVVGTNTRSSSYVLLNLKCTGDIPREIALARALFNVPSGVYINLVYRKNGVWFSVNNGGSIPSEIDTFVNLQIGIYGTATTINATDIKGKIELGSTATDYEPYQGETYDITFPAEAGTVYGGTLDVTSGVLTVDSVVRDMGSEKWVYNSTYDLFVDNGVQMKSYGTWICEIYPYKGNYLAMSDKSCGYIFTSRLAVKDSSFNRDIDAFKSAMNGVKAVTPLAEPITYPLTPQEITSLLGINNVWADTGQTAISYYDNQTSTDPYVDYSLTSAFDASTDALDKAKEVAQDLADLQAQIDGKIETWCQSTDPSTAWTTTDLKNQHDGDLWYYTGESTSSYKNNTTYKYTASTNKWTAYSASTDLFDKIDAKTSIYYGKPSAVTQNLEVGDYLVDNTDGCSYRWDGSKWVKLTDYNAAIDAIEIGGKNLLRGTKTQDTSLGNYKDSVTAIEEKLFGCTVFTSSIRWADIGFDFKKQILDRDLVKAGDLVTYSIWAKTDDTEPRNICGVWVGSYYSGTTIAVLSSEWTQYSKTFVVTEEMLEATSAIQTRFECNTDCTEGKYIYWAAPKLERGTKATDWMPAPEDVDVSIATAQSTADTAMDRATAIYGTCSTDSTINAKAVTCPNFVLFDGARIQITFTNANTASAPTLNVNSTGAKPIYINKTVTSSSNLLLWTAGSKMEFVYDGTGWIAQNVPYALYGTCSTGASTAAKAVTCNEAVICKGTTISVNMTNTNTAANATMNVGSTLAKDIYANGAKLTTNSRFNWRANTTQKFVFDGQVWRMDDDSVKALATAYITEIDDDGIMVHPEDDDTSGWAISDAIQLFKSGISYIKLWIENNIPKIRIGKEDQGHIILDNDSVDIRNGDNVLASFGATSVIGDENDWHQTIAANQTTFAKGDDIITYISPDKLYTINAEVADAFYISNYSIRNASDGKLVIGLRR